MNAVQMDLLPEVTPNGKAHSKIGASSMYRWSKCPGSVRLCEGIKSVSSVYADEGTRAHELAASLLGAQSEALTSDEADALIDSVRVYVDFVKNESDGNDLYVERRFDLSQLYPGLFGTADAVIYKRNTKTLVVVDYKHGQGIPVEVENNPQLQYYALGALLSFNEPCETVESVIVQPRCQHPDGPIRKWSQPSFKLLDFSADLVKFAEATEKPDAPLVPGGHCHFCPAAGMCPSVHSKALALAQTEFDENLPYDPKRLAEILHWIPTLKAWCNSVNEFAYHEAIKGYIPPGFKLVEKRATRKWRSEVAAEVFLSEKLGPLSDQIFKKTLVSPAQAEKLLLSSERQELEPLVVAESSGTTLVPETDKRKEKKRPTPEDDFATTES